MKCKHQYLFVTFIFVFLCGNSTQASELNDLTINAFGTVGYVKTNKKEIEGSDKNDIANYNNLTSFGVTLAKELDSRWKTQIQYIASGKFNQKMEATIDLAQISYQIDDSSLIRFGRVRLPMWLNSEIIQVGALNYWTVAPFLVYEKLTVNSITGVSYTKHIPIGSWDFQLDVFTGYEKLDQGLDSEKYSGSLNDIMGGSLYARFKNLTLLTSVQRGKLDLTVLSKANSYSGGYPVTTTSWSTIEGSPLINTVYGLKYDAGRWFIQAEKFRATLKSDAKVFEELGAYYADFGVRLGSDYGHTFFVSFSEDTDLKTTLPYQSKRRIAGIGTDNRILDNLNWKVQILQIEVLKPEVYTNPSVGIPAAAKSRFTNMLATSLNMVF